MKIPACCWLLAAAFLPPVHPHGDLPLLTFTIRAREFAASADGRATLARVEARCRDSLPDKVRVAVRDGAFADLLAKWGGRGQVDLAQHVFATLGAEGGSHDPARCEVCATLIHDAVHGEPAALQSLAANDDGILPITAHGFLAIERAGAFRAPPRPAADIPFLERALAGRDSSVARRIGLERIDLDGDGSCETSRVDADDDGTFELYHVDRDQDGAFEVDAEEAEPGKYRVRAVDARTQAVQRAAEERAAPASRPSTGTDRRDG